MPPITGGDVKSIAAVHLRERKGARTQKKRYVSFKWGSSPPLIFVIPIIMPRSCRSGQREGRTCTCEEFIIGRDGALRARAMDDVRGHGGRQQPLDRRRHE